VSCGSKDNFYVCHSSYPLLKCLLAYPAAAKRVMSLQEPHLKMSKSHQDIRSRILLTDSPEIVSKKIMAALTDSTNSVSFDPENRPGVSNLLQLLSYFDLRGRTPQELADLHAGLDLRQFKLLVSESISDVLEPIRESYEQLLIEDGGRYLDDVESQGASRARDSASETMVLVREMVGL